MTGCGVVIPSSGVSAGDLAQQLETEAYASVVMTMGDTAGQLLCCFKQAPCKLGPTDTGGDDARIDQGVKLTEHVNVIVPSESAGV